MIPNLKADGYRWEGLKIAKSGNPPTVLVSDAELIVKSYSDLSRQSHQDYTRTFTDACRLIKIDFQRLIESYT